MLRLLATVVTAVITLVNFVRHVIILFVDGKRTMLEAVLESVLC